MTLFIGYNSVFVLVLVEKLSPADLLGLLKGRGQRDPEITTALIRDVAHPLAHKTIDSSLSSYGRKSQEKIHCFGSVFIWSWSGSSILCWIPMRIRIQSGSRVSMTKNLKKITAGKKFNIFWSKIAIYLSLGLHKGRPSYRRSLHPSKGNIKHFKTWNFLIFSIFVGHICPPGSGYGSNDMIESGSETLEKFLYICLVVFRIRILFQPSIGSNTVPEAKSTRIRMLILALLLN